MSAIQDDFAAADALFAELFGDTATLVRGSAETEGVTVQMLSRSQPVAGELPTSLHLADWLVATDDYQIGGTPVLPRPGDQLKVAIGGVDYIFELLPLDSRPCYEWSDGSRQNWILHTKYVGSSV